MKVDGDEGVGISLTGNVSMDDFELLKVLGKGAYGKVFQARKIHGQHQGQLYALKSVNKSRIASSQTDIRHTKAERDVLVRTDHPFIVKLYFAFETSKRLYLVQEFCRGGELFRRMEVERMMLEEHARFYLSQIVCALEYLHSIDIVYRDLKTENVMLDEAGHVKLIDFGLSKLNMNEGALTNTFCGTVEYMAPEGVSRKGHDHVCDWWSFAVLTDEMLTGQLPFTGKDRKDTMQMILKAKLSMPQFLSQDAQALLRCLFKRNPKNRLGAGTDGAEKLKRHIFFKGIDWNALFRKEITPPFVPTLAPSDPEDAHYFDQEFTKRTPRDSPAIPASAGANRLFRGFSFSRKLQVADTNATDTMKAESDFRNEAPEGFFLTNVPYEGYVKKSFKTEYELLDTLGRGAFSEVRKCRHKHTGKCYAVKISKREMNGHEGMRDDEIQILIKFGQHPNIITVKDIFIEPDENQEMMIWMVTELMEGGEMFHKIERQKSLCEREASAVMKTVTQTVEYLHSNDVAHRDLKPSNILYADDSGDPTTIRIVDFGFAKQLRHENGMLMTPCFTKSYVAPEVLNKQAYDLSCDIWSLGCLMYTMLGGETPFDVTENDTPEVVLKKLNSNKMKLSGGNWDYVSEQAKDLLKQMLNFDSSKRPTAKNVLCHNWIKDGNNLPQVDLSSIKNPRSANNAIGQSINIITQSRQSQNASTLQPVSHKSVLFKRRTEKKGLMKMMKIPTLKL
jgi:p90 ribosomal S6 kinase